MLICPIKFELWKYESVFKMDGIPQWFGQFSN